MKYFVIFQFLVFLFINQHLHSQKELNQTVRGSVFDHITHEPLTGANIVLIGSDPFKGTTTDVEGKFRLENVPVGRIDLQVSFMGYNTVTYNRLPLTSGKELVLEVGLEEKVFQGNEVEIKAKRHKSRPMNKMASISARSFSVEESRRYAGSRNDVARMASNFAGVRGADDSRNDIIIRGNSPIGLLWRLEDVDIPNPNHYGALGTTGGPVSILNNNLLSSSDFITAAFPAEYGNALAGVFDLNMRNGNNEQFEFLGQIGFNGFELGGEGPLDKDKGSSFLANFRYSTLEVFEKLGMDFGTGTAVPKYKDFSFKLNIPNTKLGNISIFGLGGISDIAFLDSEKDTSEVNLYAGEGFDLVNSSDMAVLGLNQTYAISKSTYTKFVLAYSYHNFKTCIDSIAPGTRDILPQYRNDFREQKLFASLQLVNKINSQHNFKTGIIAKQLNFDLVDSAARSNGQGFNTITDYNEATYLVHAFLQWQYRISEKIRLNPGLHYQLFTLNNTFVIEPRIGLNWNFTPVQTLSMGYGLHSQLMPITVYFNQEKVPDGGYQRLNENLDMIKSQHFVLGHDWIISEYLRMKSEVYYQHISDAAVDAHSRNSYSVLNQGANFFIATPDTLKNTGTGDNVGFELTLEHFLKDGFYFLLTTSLYDSKYKGSDEVERNTAFNGGYVINALTGKEYNISNWFKTTTKRFNLIFDIKTTWAGGQRYTPINVEKSMEKGRRIYFDKLAYSEQYKDYFRTDFRVALRQNSKKVTMEWAIDVQNIFNTNNIYRKNFNTQTGEVSDIYQLGILIVPQFRLEF